MLEPRKSLNIRDLNFDRVADADARWLYLGRKIESRTITCPAMPSGRVEDGPVLQKCERIVGDFWRLRHRAKSGDEKARRSLLGLLLCLQIPDWNPFVACSSACDAAVESALAGGTPGFVFTLDVPTLVSVIDFEDVWRLSGVIGQHEAEYGIEIVVEARFVKAVDQVSSGKANQLMKELRAREELQEPRVPCLPEIRKF